MISATGNRPQPQRGQQAFSLIEIVLVIGLIALVAGMLVGNIGLIADRGDELNSDAQIKAAIRAARFEAAQTRSVVTLSYSDELGQLNISSESSEGRGFALGPEFGRDGRGEIRFFLVPSSQGLESLDDPSRTRMEVSAVQFAPDRSSSPFVLEIDYGFGSPERHIYDPFSSLTIQPE